MAGDLQVKGRKKESLQRSKAINQVYQMFKEIHIRRCDWSRQQDTANQITAKINAAHFTGWLF
jgi:hypothetical protein